MFLLNLITSPVTFQEHLRQLLFSVRRHFYQLVHFLSHHYLNKVVENDIMGLFFLSVNCGGRVFLWKRGRKITQEEMLAHLCGMLWATCEEEEPHVAHFSEVRSSVCTLVTFFFFFCNFFLQSWNGITLSDKIFYLRGESTARSRPESHTERLFCVGLMMGSAYFTVLVSFVLLSHLLQVKEAIRCTETKPLLRELPVGVSQLSECVLECTGLTYFKKLRLQDKRTIKFQMCTEGEVSFCRHHVSSSLCHFLNVKFLLKVLEANRNRVTDVRVL